MPVSPSSSVRRYSGARVGKSGDQVLGGAADLTWDTEQWDTDGYHDAADNTKLTAPTAGLYRITLGFRMSGDVAGFAGVIVNGVGQHSDFAAISTRGLSLDVQLAAGDVVVINFNAAATVKAGGGGFQPAFFAIERLLEL